MDANKSRIKSNTGRYGFSKYGNRYIPNDSSRYSHCYTYIPINLEDKAGDYTIEFNISKGQNCDFYISVNTTNKVYLKRNDTITYIIIIYIIY